MNSSTTQPTDVKPVDPDVAEQAVPGHGVPSQDPNPAAQVALDPEEAERESKSVLMGGGLVAGSAAGAAVGAAVAGPVGVLVGGAIGAVAGALGGGAAGELASPESTTNADEAPKDADGTHRGIPPR
jgi:phage tail tape-measure protein